MDLASRQPQVFAERCVLAGRGEEIKGSLEEGVGAILHNEDIEAAGRAEKNRIA